ncbi:MAG: RDD family protein [Bernardetiaceae bacterium]|jgi:uncharacterized RDD family membrane protein YckC|nr:RDD family protein [Bernardetiaceae bacterium]
MALPPFSHPKPSYVSASRNQRFVNGLIDGLVILGLAFLSNVLWGWGQLLWASAPLEGDASPTLVSGSLHPPAFLIGSWLVYYFGLEGLWGRTLGKLLTRTVVVAADGGRPTWGAVALRTLCRLVPLEAVTHVVSRDRQGLHDWASRTRVVRWQAPNQEITV